ncbi:unnamed protein product, partial [Effrenium voratum]
MARLRRSCNARNARCRRQKVVVSSAYVLLSGGNSAATPPGVEVAFLAPGKISSRHVAKVLGLVAKKSDVQAEGTLLVLRDKTMSSKYTLVLALVALVAEDPEKLPALKELVLRSATEGQLPVEQWPQELQALVGPPDAEIHPELLAEAYVIARHGDGPDWDFMASLLGAYRLREGHSEVPPNHREVGLELGDWLAGQRVRAAEGQLGPERFQRLQDFGVCFTEQKLEWQRRYSQLMAFRNLQGDADVEELSRWIKDQRSKSRRKKLSQAQRRQLELLGIDMPGEPAASREELWAAKLAALKRFMEREGHADVPSKHMEDGIKLGAWIDSVRSSFKAGKLPAARAAQLQDLGLELKQRRAQFDSYLEALEQFVGREDHSHVPLCHVEGKLALGQWLESQRRCAFYGRMEE